MDTGRNHPAHARRPRRPVWIVRGGLIAAAVALAATGAIGASAAPAPTAASPTGVGTIPPLPPPPAQDQAALVAGAARAAKAEVSFPLPLQIQRVYATYNVVLGPNTFVSDSAAYAVQKDAAGNPVYGEFPDTDTVVLGFGALPVTATIHLTQTTDENGTINLIKIHNESISRPDGSQTNTTTVTGQVLLRLSDVAVDKVPIDVGPACVGSAPIDLVLNGADSGQGRPTDYNPFDGGLLRGTFAVPTFTGCGTGGQDLDPLLTSAVSGPGNGIVLSQGPLGDWDPTARQYCRIANTRTPCATPPPAPFPTGS